MVGFVEPQVLARMLGVIRERSPLASESVELLSEAHNILSELLEPGEVTLDSNLQLRAKTLAA